MWRKALADGSILSGASEYAVSPRKPYRLIEAEAVSQIQNGNVPVKGVLTLL
jgi:hypothetical protein